jgi:hypothetical protein
MSDIVVNDEVTVSVVTASDGNVVVSTVSSTSVVRTSDTDTVIEESSSTSVVETDNSEVVISESESVTILTEGTQGPAGASGLGAAIMVREAGEDLVEGDPVYISANKFYKASCLAATGVIGVVSKAALTTQVAEATAMGVVGVPGLVSGATYFLGVGEMATTPPTSGYVIRMGRAISSTILVLNIEEPVLLAA